MKKLLLLLLLTSGLWAQTPTNFDLVAYEGFDYVSGTSLFNASSGNGWTSNWEQSYQQQYLKTSTTGFTYAGLTTAGKKAEWDSNCYGGSCNGIASLKRAFPLQNSGVVYFQFISVLESSGGFGTPNIRLYNSTTLTGGFGASTGTKMSILNAGLANLSSSSGNLNAQNLVVVRIDYNLNKTEMWINPNLTTFDYSNPTGPSATANIAPEFDSFQLFMRSGSIDEVSIFKSITGLNRYGKITSTNADFVNKNGALGGNNLLTINGEQVFMSSADGLSAASAGISALQIKTDFPSSVDGVYWIDVPGYGPKQTYCLMDSAHNGGGWMLALKTTTGTTFNYEATYWTTANTLNPNDVTRNNADAKYDVMNGFLAKDMMALWPDIPNVAAESGSIDGLTQWSWLQNDFHGSIRTTLISKFTGSQVAYYTSTNGTMTFTGYNSGKFSNQAGFTFYGLNYNTLVSAKVRWGFAWNNETNQGSNDVSGGIGMSSTYGNYSAGDKINCCQNTTGINRSARVEIYIR